MSGQEAGFPGSLSFLTALITLLSGHHLLRVTYKVCQRWSGSGGRRTLLLHIFLIWRGVSYSHNKCLFVRFTM